jgi:hypothetical protein
VHRQPVLVEVEERRGQIQHNFFPRGPVARVSNRFQRLTGALGGFSETMAK